MLALREPYREAEASRVDPSGDLFYESVKARVIAGELTLNAAAAEIDWHHQKAGNAVTCRRNAARCPTAAPGHGHRD